MYAPDVRIPEQPKRLSLWQILSFSDVNPLIRALGRRAATWEDLHGLPASTLNLRLPATYPEQGGALAQLRRSTFATVLAAERPILRSMLLIHLVDVLLSVAGALVSVQVLKTFEDPGDGPTGFRIVDAFPFVQNTPLHLFFFVAVLAVVIFAANLLAASLHAQKIEREMLLSYRIQAKITEYLFQHVLGMSRQDRLRYPTGDLVNLAQADARSITEFFAHAAVDLPVLLVSTTLIMGILYLIVGPAAWVGFGLVLIQIPLSLAFSWLTTRLHRELMSRSDKRISLVTEWIQGMRLVRYFGWGRHFQKEIETSASAEFRQELKVSVGYSAAFALSTTWWMVVSLGMFGAYLYWGVGKDASRIFASIWLLSILGHQLVPLPWFVSSFAHARVGSRRLEGVFRARTSVSPDRLKAHHGFRKQAPNRRFEDLCQPLHFARGGPERVLDAEINSCTWQACQRSQWCLTGDDEDDPTQFGDAGDDVAHILGNTLLKL